ncbi:MAG: AAA family ATPase [Pseudonocardiales bacterium]
MRKPADLFDREWEWGRLVDFMTDPRPTPTLGVVSGRRRQGKTMLLQSVAEQAGGFFFEAVQGQPAEQLRLLGAALAEHLRLPAALDLPDWSSALDALLDLARERSLPVVLDEFSYLVTASPALPSLLQAALSPAQRRSRPTRLVVCGSAISLMGSLLTANAPLRGRAGLELVVHGFDYRTAGEFWKLGDRPDVAFAVFAVLGGTPAYAREFVREDAPADGSDLERWLTERVLDPASPLFREGPTLLAEDPELSTVRDRSLYHSVLAAVAGGNRTTSAVASYVRRSSDQLAHPLRILVEAGLLDRAGDPLRRGRPQYRVNEPIIRFHHAVMRPRWAALQRRTIDWPRIRPTLRAQIFGPAFEELARTWTERFASPTTLGGDVERVGHTVVADPASRVGHEVDVLVVGTAPDGAPGVLAVGEATADEVITRRHVDRLRRVRELLGVRAVPGCRLLCFSGAGFAPELLAAPPSPDVVLVDLARLYQGS